MRTKQKRILSVVIGVVGLVVLALGTILILNVPAGAEGIGFGHHGWMQHQALAGGAQGAGEVESGVMGQCPQGFGGHNGVAGHQGRGGHGMGLFFLIGVVIVVAIVLFAHRGRHHKHAHGCEGSGGSPEDIVRRSFAEGKIDEAEFKSRLAALRGKGE